MASSGCVILFTKPALPGRVKTRLVGDLTPEEAAALHAAFVRDLVERLIKGSFDLQVAWDLEPGEGPPADLLPVPLGGFAQQGLDLGERLFQALDRVGEQEARVAAVGSDHPDLPLLRVEEAFERLASGAELVLGPALDGGYYLVAVRASSLDRRLFEEISWSTERVLDQTLERARELGLKVELLAPGADVDTPEDLRRLARSASLAESCPHTSTLLVSMGRRGGG